MKCSNCSEDSVFYVNWKGKNYCPKHFRSYFLAQIGTVLDRYGVSGKIAVALSGGKDSSACLEALTHFERIDVKAFHIDLGIGDYSKGSLKAAERICDYLGVDLTVLVLEDEFGVTIPKLSERENGKPCALCGMVKRYLINSYAYENGFDYVATGHNLSDEVSSTFNNLANVYLTPFRGLAPVLEDRNEYKLLARVKPLYFLKDDECKVFADVNEIPYFSGECPLSTESPTEDLKDWLHELDSRKPRILRNFAKAFMQIEEKMDTNHEELKNCENCGYATATKICRFCRVVRGVNSGSIS